MNNRYLYRAKRVDTGEWVEGSLITGVFFRLGQDIPYILCPDKADYDCFEDFSEENGIFEVDSSTICQGTGRKGEWEHDVFQCDDERYEIQFCEDSLTWEAVSVFSSESIELGEFIPSEYVRLGNSIDNPELLEVEE